MAQREKRIGIMLPSSNTTVEYDFQRLVPRNVSIHAARMWNVDTGVDALVQMNRDMEMAARHIGSAEVDVIAYACTGGSLLEGAGYDRKVTARISEITGGIPAVTTSTSILQAFAALGMQRICVTTPYPDDLNEKVIAFLHASGIRVLGLAGRRHKLNRQIGADTPDVIFDFTMQHLSPSADGLFLSCTNWQALDVVERLEKTTGKPVVTSNQATIWATFREIGLAPAVAGYGSLLETLKLSRV